MLLLLLRLEGGSEKNIDKKLLLRLEGGFEGKMDRLLLLRLEGGCAPSWTPMYDCLRCAPANG